MSLRLSGDTIVRANKAVETTSAPLAADNGPLSTANATNDVANTTFEVASAAFETVSAPDDTANAPFEAANVLDATAKGASPSRIEPVGGTRQNTGSVAGATWNLSPW